MLGLVYPRHTTAMSPMIDNETCAFLTCVRTLLPHAGTFFLPVNVNNSLSFGNLLSTLQLDLCFVVVVLMTCSCADTDVKTSPPLDLTSRSVPDAGLPTIMANKAYDSVVLGSSTKSSKS